MRKEEKSFEYNFLEFTFINTLASYSSKISKVVTKISDKKNYVK